MDREKKSRREFLESVALGIAGAGAIPSLAKSEARAAAGEMTYRTLGRSGEKVSMLGLGGYHIGVPPGEQESTRIIRTAIDSGINFLDNCWDYYDGARALHVAKAIPNANAKRYSLIARDGEQSTLAS